MYYDFIFIIASLTFDPPCCYLIRPYHFTSRIWGGEDFLTSLPPATTALYLFANFVLVIYSDNTKRIVRSSFILVFWGDYLIATAHESSANEVFASGLRNLKLRAKTVSAIYFEETVSAVLDNHSPSSKEATTLELELARLYPGNSQHHCAFCRRSNTDTKLDCAILSVPF